LELFLAVVDPRKFMPSGKSGRIESSNKIPLIGQRTAPSQTVCCLTLVELLKLLQAPTGQEVGTDLLIHSQCQAIDFIDGCSKLPLKLRALRTFSGWSSFKNRKSPRHLRLTRASRRSKGCNGQVRYRLCTASTPGKRANGTAARMCPSTSVARGAGMS
jgi:hypothetical protein